MTRAFDSRSTLRSRLANSNLLFLSLLTSLDGSILALAAAGELSTLADAVLAGLTIVAGAGCWLAARAEYGQRALDGRDFMALSLKGAIVMGATGLAAWVGSAISAAGGGLPILSAGGGVVLSMVALELSGIQVPRFGKVPATMAVLATFASAEVALRWIP